MKQVSNDDRVIKALREAFGPTVQFELVKESDTLYRVKVTGDDDATIADGLETMKSERLRSVIDGGVAVKMISDHDANEYDRLAASSSDPMLRAGYEVLAREARGG
jgi:hypothetical protein